MVGPVTPKPTASQLDEVGQETLSSSETPSGSVWALQVVPPSVVVRATPGPKRFWVPTATHCVGLGHEMPKSSGLPSGMLWGFHVSPPSVVATTLGLPRPTAQQSLVLGQET